jgi:D-amino peptidase
MKLYISCDMEGVAGVCSWEQVDARTPHSEYAIYRRWMTREVNAAIEGARKAGAIDVLINDSHGPMRNLDFEELPSDVRVLSGNRKPFSMVQGIDETFTGAFFTGYHGAIGDANAVLCHTYTPSLVYGLRINGVNCSEATLNAALLGHFGVPLLLVTGDRTTVEGVQAQMPWVHGVIVKESIGNFAANSITPVASQQLIREAAFEVMSEAQNTKAAAQKLFRFEAPIVLDLDVLRVEQADSLELIPGFERRGPRSVRITHNDYPTIFKAFVLALRVGA